MILSKKKFAKMRAKKIKNQPKLLIDTYYIYDNPKLIQDTYTAKKLHNTTLYYFRQALYKHHKWLMTSDLYKIIKRRTDNRENMLYRQMQLAKTAQGVVKQVGMDISNYGKAMSKFYKNPHKFQGKPKMPNYLRHPRTSFQLNHQSFSFGRGNIVIHSYGVKVPIYKHYDINGNEFYPKYHNIWVVPIHRGVDLRCSYEPSTMKSLLSDNGIYVGIDPGVNNMFTLACNKAVKPCIINGKPLKSINQWANKLIALDRHQLAKFKQNSYTIHTKTGIQTKYADSHRIQEIFVKRNLKINYEAHNAIMCIIAYAQNCGAHTIIIGKNKYWKDKSNMSAKNNQNFINIPHARMIDQLTYRASMYGIAVITTNESYTSQTSFLDGEQPIKENGNIARKEAGKKPFKRRIKRGLFKSDKCILINSDVNSALQIIKKVVPQVSFDRGIETVVLQPYKLNPSFGRSLYKRK